MTPWLLILAGLVVLTVGAELLVRGAAWIAEAMGVRHMIVGLTVVAIGTSAPELVVSIIAAVEGKVDLVLGNVYGSNIANLALIMGATAVMAPIHAGQGKIRFELFWLLGAGVFTLLPFATGSFDQVTGSAMVIGLIIFLYWLVQRERRARPERAETAPPDRSTAQVIRHALMIPLGLGGLALGGDWLVSGATEIATTLGLSDGVIGATVVAVGTSLPELATSIMAARKGHPELALGNIIGSNIFNILMVIGITATLIPLNVSWEEQALRTLVSLALTIYLAILLLGPKYLSRTTGAILLAVYVTYLALEVINAPLSS